MTSDELCYLTIAEVAPLLERRELSPVELTSAFLDRIESLDGTLHAYITVVPERAMAQARSAEAEIMGGAYRGPLHGIPIALKDLYDTKGIRTTASSRVMADRVPDEDATATARLEAAGAILLGKLAMHEFALGGPDPTCGFVQARNPWNVDHIPGGSSSGSGTAVAAGLCMGSLGSCTGGSIRGPAAYCNMVGLKPTYGRVSRHGVVPLSWSLDHCGPMTWTVEDAATMLQVIAGHDPKDLSSSRAPVPDYRAAFPADIEGLRIGVPRHFCWIDDPRVDTETLALVDVALNELSDLGAHVEDVTIPTLDYAEAAMSAIMLGEAFSYHRHNLQTRPEDFGDLARTRIRVGGFLSATDYVQGQRARSVVRRDFAAALERVDVLVHPTMSGPAPAFSEVGGVLPIKRKNFTPPYNLTGLPAISVPCGFTAAGLPVGLHIAGRPFDEVTVLRVAHAYEQRARWFEQRPPVRA